MSRCQIESRTTVNDALKELEQLEILKKIRRPNQCTKYVLIMDAIVNHSTTGDTTEDVPGGVQDNGREGTEEADSTVYDTTESTLTDTSGSYDNRFR
jgi:hypothetical protein